MKPNTLIRYYNETPIRCRWDKSKNEWSYAVMDVIESLVKPAYPRKYWNTFKHRRPELLKKTKSIKLTSSDDKKYATDVMNYGTLECLLGYLKYNKKEEFLNWAKSLANPLDEESRIKAYSLIDNDLLNEAEVGTFAGLQKIHSYLFEGLYPYAGKIREKNISKSGFKFVTYGKLADELKKIDEMPETSLDEIIDKYVQMNIAHPFEDGNGVATRIWLNQIFRKNLNKVIDWSRINKEDYLKAMEASPTDSSEINNLFFFALVYETESKEVFLRGIDFSYSFEEE